MSHARSSKKPPAKNLAAKPDTKQAQSLPIHFTEFQTQLIKIFNKTANKKTLPKSRFNTLLASHQLFKKVADKKTMTVAWQIKDKTKPLIAIPAKLDAKDNSIAGKLDIYGENKLFTITLKADNELIIDEEKITSTDAEWDAKATNEFASSLCTNLRAKKMVFSTRRTEIATSSEPSAFDKRTLDQLTQQYQHESLTFKINNVILKHATEKNNAFTFDFQWPNSNGKPETLRASFARSCVLNKSTSNFVNEETLYNQFPEYAKYKPKLGQFCYSLTVSEPDPDKKNSAGHRIFRMWLTLDGTCSELHTIARGKLSGNEIIEMYKYFDAFFKPKHAIVCDAAELTTNEDDPQSVKLRVIAALATNCTWYEGKIPGLTLFPCKNLKSVYFDSMDQTPAGRNKALRELQQLPLHKWFEMLNNDDKNTLAQLYDTYLRPKPILLKRSKRTRNTPADEKHSQIRIIDKKSTLKDLAICVYNNAKLQKKLTPDLLNFTKLIYGDMDSDFNMQPDDKQKDYWVKVRARELLWGSYYWIKTRAPDEKAPAVAANRK